jgi:hypothetical protein
VRGALVTGFVHRAFDGASDDSMLLRAVLEYYQFGVGRIGKTYSRPGEMALPLPGASDGV